jgi:hypothetical protein
MNEENISVVATRRRRRRKRSASHQKATFDPLVAFPGGKSPKISSQTRFKSILFAARVNPVADTQHLR